MKAVIALLLAAAFCAGGLAQEFKPYSAPKITPDQWQGYLDEVVRRHGASRQDAVDEHLVMFTDTATATNFIFTAPGHPAHPAWIARRMVQNGDNLAVRQVGFYAGAFAPFADLFKSYLETTERIREDLERKRTDRPS